jgi:hypothetical protein
LKFGSPNLLEPSGPAQACTGIGLPFLSESNLLDQVKLRITKTTDVMEIQQALYFFQETTTLQLPHLTTKDGHRGGQEIPPLYSMPKFIYLVYKKHH